MWFQDIGGNDIQKQEIKEAVELPLTHHELYRQIGIDPPRGVLLYGPPGTGKTMLAKAVAHHTTAAFIRVVGSEFVQKYLGEVSVLVPLGSTDVSMSPLLYWCCIPPEPAVRCRVTSSTLTGIPNLSICISIQKSFILNRSKQACVCPSPSPLLHAIFNTHVMGRLTFCCIQLLTGAQASRSCNHASIPNL